MSAFFLSDDAWMHAARILTSGSDTFRGSATFAEGLVAAVQLAAPAIVNPMTDREVKRMPSAIREQVAGVVAVRLCWEANRQAVGFRYGNGPDAVSTANPAPAILAAAADWHSAMDTAERIVPAVKVLQCLDYQCAEDVPAEWRAAHDAIRAELGDVIKTLSLRLVRLSPLYDAAKWG